MTSWNRDKIKDMGLDPDVEYEKGPYLYSLSIDSIDNDQEMIIIYFAGSVVKSSNTNYKNIGEIWEWSEEFGFADDSDFRFVPKILKDKIISRCKEIREAFIKKEFI